MQPVTFAEVRLDCLTDPSQDLRPLFRGTRRLIATCRPGKLQASARIDVLRRAIDAGARCIDIELETPRRLRATLLQEAGRAGVEVMVSSHHDYTPPPALLRRLHDRCFLAGADIAKIACEVKTPRDNGTLLGLLASGRRLVLVGMGRQGLATRLMAPLLGAEFTFAAQRGAGPNALGQLSFHKTLRAMEALQRATGG